MKERQITTALWALVRANCSIALPRYTPRAWFECDLWAVQADSGLAHEFEIKLSVADFRADVAKSRLLKSVVDKKIIRTPVLKHELLAAKDSRGPSRFWYVLPSGMIGLADVPQWAGVRTVERTASGFRFTLARSAPLLHTRQVAFEEIEKARTAAYYRYWKERLRTYVRELRDEVLK